MNHLIAEVRADQELIVRLPDGEIAEIFNMSGLDDRSREIVRRAAASALRIAHDHYAKEVIPVPDHEDISIHEWKPNT